MPLPVPLEYPSPLLLCCSLSTLSIALISSSVASGSNLKGRSNTEEIKFRFSGVIGTKLVAFNC